MKPYIVCHMIMSVDGRIDCPMVGQLSGDEYYTALEKLEPCSKLSGRTTMALECNEVREQAGPMEGEPMGHTAMHMALRAPEYTLVADTLGKLRWNSDTADGMPLLCIVSEQVSQGYLDALSAKGISWIAAGRKEIDLDAAMEILHDSFGIERVAVVGGGHICGGFLKAGLLDEISIMVAPGIDGRAGQTAVFDGIKPLNTAPYPLRLQSMERLENDVIWLRYLTRR